MKRAKKILLLMTLIVVNSCNTTDRKIEVGYIFHESTGSTHHILYNSEEIPIRFSKDSDTNALISLKALKPSILYPNSNGNKIFLIGSYNENEQTFLLQRWYIKVPFKEWVTVDLEKIPHETKIVERESLKRTDFEKIGNFDPGKKDFNPDFYQIK